MDATTNTPPDTLSILRHSGERNTSCDCGRELTVLKYLSICGTQTKLLNKKAWTEVSQ